jgi:tetratricopeptide (TPR) repeat protein
MGEARHGTGRGCCRFVALVIAFATVATAGGADVADAEKLLRTGKYAECEKLAADEIAGGTEFVRWWELKARAEVARGRYDEAGKTIQVGRTKAPYDLAFHLFAHDVYRTGGKDNEAKEVLAAVQRRIDDRVTNTPADKIALGRHLLATGTDAKEVLDKLFLPAVKQSPDFLDAHLATAELALAKHDRAFAAETLQKAPKAAADSPHYHFLTARAFADDDRERADKAVADALAVNPHHADSLLHRADRRITADDYTAAEEALKAVLDVDPGEPRAWAYRAAIANLKADPAGEKEARTKALARWDTNPQVDHIIGRTLSQDYRFKEGAAYQRLSLEKDPKHLPAKAQLAQDLLRLGDEKEGWKLAAEVFAADGYDVVAHNLVSLRDHLAKFRTLTADGFVLRMDDLEADLYGPRALALLQRAKKVLTEKYGVKLDETVTVEIFPKNQDFAVRTFGMPGADGFLGVCFGPVITVNSPASQGKDPSNWEAVLWHEFCHTVTLHKTRNKMPRWLSEGISVYEELQENPAWGQWLNPKYRDMILGDDLTPLSKLTSAFMTAKSALHVQFAYYESAVAVEFLVTRFGFDTLTGLLDDIGKGLFVNEALERRTGAKLTKLDADFETFIRDKAKATAPTATWEKVDLADTADSAAIRAWLEKRPKNFWAQQRLAAALVKEEKWAEAEKEAVALRDLYPEYVGPTNAYELLAATHRKTGNAKDEAAALGEWAKRDGDATAAFQRLIELHEAAGDWPAAAENARRWLAVHPLTAAPHRALAKAAEKAKDHPAAITAYRGVLRFGVPDAADVRYRLAVVLDQAGEKEKAKREVLKALEDAPRSREAHELLLKLADPEKKR